MRILAGYLPAIALETLENNWQTKDGKPATMKQFGWTPLRVEAVAFNSPYLCTLANSALRMICIKYFKEIFS